MEARQLLMEMHTNQKDHEHAGISITEHTETHFSHDDDVEVAWNDSPLLVRNGGGWLPVVEAHQARKKYRRSGKWRH